MNGTKIEVLSRDTRIEEYLCQWSPLTRTEHIVGLCRTILVLLLADGLCDEEFQQEFPHAPRHGHTHMYFAERKTGAIVFQLLKIYGQCPECSSKEFDLLPYTEAREIQLILCRCCGSWVGNDGIYEWQKIGSGSGG